MGELRITESGDSRYYICVSKNADRVTRRAAEELCRELYASTRALVPYHSDLCAKLGPELLVGENARGSSLYAEIDFAALGSEGYAIRTSPEGDILICGGSPRGTLYGVYAFLEEFCGVYRLTANCVIRKPVTSLVIPETFITSRPAFECREVYWREAFDGAFAAQNRINSGKAEIPASLGGCIGWFNFHHAMYDLVPPDEYFDSHPEYFALSGGKRRREGSQLCLTDPEVARIAAQTVLRWARENPDCTVFSIAQNDNQSYCECERCAALDAAEGSHAASLLLFSNRVCELVERERPDILLHTFAYQYTRKPPAAIVPHKNLIVRLCSIECSVSHPLTYYERFPDSPEELYLRDLRGWSAICGRLYVWDYVTNFANYLLPFPNLYSLGKNLRLYRDLGVKGVFEEGNFSVGGGGAMAELEAFVQARLLWDPDRSVRDLTELFLRGYYGDDAAAPVGEYLSILNQTSVGDYRIYEYADHRLYSKAFVDMSISLLRTAYTLASTPEQKRRVKKAMLSVEFLRLTRLPADYPGRDGLIDAFHESLKDFGVTELFERAPLEWSVEVMKKSPCCRDRTPHAQVVYYRM